METRALKNYTISKLMVVVRLLLIWLYMVSALAHAQDDLDPSTIHPLSPNEIVDSRGIDMISGRHAVSGMALSIGSGSSSLRRDTGTARMNMDNLTASLTLISVDRSAPNNPMKEPAIVRIMELNDGLYYQVSALGYSEIFYVGQLGSGHSNADGALANRSHKGGSLTCNKSNNSCEYTSRHGDVVEFDKDLKNNHHTLKGYVSEGNVGLATRIEKADGEVLTYHHQKVSGYQSYGSLYDLPSAVVSSLGWLIKYSFNDFNVTSTQYSRVETDSRSICAMNIVKEYVDIENIHCEQLSSSYDWPVATLARTTHVNYNGDHSIYNISTKTRVANPESNADEHYRTFGKLNNDQKETYTTPQGVATAYDIGDYDFNSYDLYTETPSTGNLTEVVIDGIAFPYGHEMDAHLPIDDDNGDGIPEYSRTSPDGTYEIDDFDRLVAFTDKMATRKRYHYHSTYVNSISRVDYPDGRYDTYSYDGRGNVTYYKEYPNDGGAPLVTHITYWTCSSSTQKYCNKPKSITTPNGATTRYTYYSAHGGVDTITKPSVAVNGNTVYPKIVHSYTQYTPYAKFNSSSLTAADRPIWRLTKVTQCRTASTCSGSLNELVKTTHYDKYENLLPDYKVRSTGDGSVSLRTDFEYDEYGNLAKEIGPHPNEISYRFYDLQQRVVGTIGPDENGQGRVGTYKDYNSDGQITYTKTGLPGGTTFSALQNMYPVTAKSTIYDSGSGLVSKQRTEGSDVDKVLVDMSYDAKLRLKCRAVRVSGYSNNDACAANSGTFGADRISKYEYNRLNEVVKATSGYDTGVSRIDRKDFYNRYGKLTASQDGEQNETQYKYDSFGRVDETWYPSPATGSANPNDKMAKTYDGTRVKTIRLRNGNVITFQYDNWGRVIQKTGAVTESFAYDLFGNVTSHTNSTSGVLSNSTTTKYYNAFSWKEYEQTRLGKVSYEYDSYGRRTELEWPDGFYVTYDYGNSLLLQSIKEKNTSTVLASYDYDNLGRRDKLIRGNNVTTDYELDDFSRVTSMTTNVGGSSTIDDYQVDFEYNPASQIVTKTLTIENQSYQYTPATTSESYAPNGLNQITNWSGTSISYDANGNLKQLGSMTYHYNNDNLMTKAGGTNLYYDAEKRLHKVGSTCFLYDGQDLIAETNCSGSVINRYIHGAGTNDPVVWYVGSGTTSKRYYTSDYKGSIIGVTNNSGTSYAINSYDEYGVPETTNVGRFQFTGQIWLGEVGLYYYKARFYHSELGRFMQADPIGYKDGMNWYAYVGNDPVNLSDPTGLHRYDSIIGSAPYAKGRGAAISGSAFKMSLLTSKVPLDDAEVSGGEIIGKTWNLPNTLMGVAYGSLGHILGEIGQALGLWSEEPVVGFGNNALEFTGNPFAGGGALTLGNTITWGAAKNSNTYRAFSDHERRHTVQGQFTGLLYLPAHITAMSASLLSSPVASMRRTVPGASKFVHGKLNFMEGPIFKDELY